MMDNTCKKNLKNIDFGRTDLAVENSEKFKKDNVEIKGVEIYKENYLDNKILITRVEINTNYGAGVMEKPIGTYTTIESRFFPADDEMFHHQAALIIAKEIKKLIIKKHGKINKSKKNFLVAGLGNRDITADALGPKVVELININGNVYAISPGVMARSGMESASIIKGIVKEVKPDFVIAIDSLAARNTSRLNTTIQITDTGISPGSGVGNHRCGLNEETIGVPVIAIGVPMVVNAATIVNDALENLLNAINASELISTFSREERFRLSAEIIEPVMCTMFVTTDHIDENVSIMAETIAESINSLA